MTHQAEVADLIKQRDELDRMSGQPWAGPNERRSLAARKAHVSRKLKALELATATAAPVREPAADGPLPPARIVAETEAMLAAHGVYGYRAKVSQRMTRAYGCCDYGKREVRVSGPLAAINTAAQTRDTIAHEVAHAIAGHGAGHGPAWKAACKLTGARPVRCYDAVAVNAVARRWVGHCESCGEQVDNRAKRPTRESRHIASRCASLRAGGRGGVRRVVWTDRFDEGTRTAAAVGAAMV